MIQERLRRMTDQAVPLPQALQSLREEAWKAECPPLRQFGNRRLRLSGEAEHEWFRRAWWGAMAGQLIRTYLYEKALRPYVLALIDDPDGSELEAARASGGVILAGAHFGPPHVAMNTLLERRWPLIIWAGQVQYPEWLSRPGVEWVDPVMDRSTLARTAMHLRKGGVLYGAADAARGNKIVKIPTGLGWPVNLAAGIPALVRLLKLPAFRYEATWNGDRIRVRYRRLAAPDLSLPPDEWDRQWLQDYWTESAEMYRTAPENLQMLRNLEKGMIWKALGL